MDKLTAQETLGLNNSFSMIELAQSYNIITKNVVDQFNIDDHDLMQSLANQLYEFSDAFLALQSEIKNHDAEQQPLIIFTDASVQRKKKHAAFAIVIKNIPFSFDVPLDILKKYNIRIDPESSGELCILTGEILNQNVDAAEIMAIIASVDIFCYLIRISKQKLVIYTDSLNAKKILGNKRMPPKSKTYSLLRKNFLDIIDSKILDVTIKKVAAHTGIKLNEISDKHAKIRLRDSQ